MQIFGGKFSYKSDWAYSVQHLFKRFGEYSQEKQAIVNNSQMSASQQGVSPIKITRLSLAPME